MKKNLLILSAFLICEIAFGQVQDINSLKFAQENIIESFLDIETSKVFFLHSIAVTTRIDVGIEVPWITKFSLKPEIELYWTR